MQNFFEQFVWAAGRHAARVAVEVQRKDAVDSYTYGRLREMAERTAAWLSLIGVGAGDRCAILADNDAHWCAAYLGILRRGAVAVPFDTAYQPQQIAALLRDCGARVCFTAPRYLDAARAGLTAADIRARIVLLRGEAPDAVSFEGMVGARTPAPPLPTCPSRLDDAAVILYTSGTTSDPKGVVLTHANLLAERTAAFQVVRVDERDCVLGVLPLFHSLAQMANLLLPLSIGARVVFLESVNTTELLRALRERGVTIFACVPQFFYLIHQRVTSEVAKAGLLARGAFRLLLACNGLGRRAGLNAGPLLFRRAHGVLGGRMRLMVTGGSRFDPAIGADLYCLGFDILQAYGLTETSGAATLTRPGDPALQTVGPPLPGVEVRIAQPDAGGGEGELADGEVLIRGPVVMRGYFNRADATAAAIRDGWLHTGDLGRLDARGRLSITGRSKDLIVLGSGKNIYPEEIEAVYRRSPFIGEICVLGVSRPGEPAADRLYAVVVPDAAVLRERRIANVGDLLRFEMEGASVYLPPHKRVLGYEIWNEPLPRTTTGKVKRFEVERRVKAAACSRASAQAPALGPSEREWLDREEVAPVVAAIAAAKPGVSIAPDTNLELDLGLDSMERVELLTALEHRFGADIPEGELQHLHTVRQVAEAVLAHSSAGAVRPGATPWAALLAPEASDEAAAAGWLDPHRVVPGGLFLALKLARLLLRPGVRIRLEGTSRFPARGPFLICPNHQSYLDPFFLVAALPYRLARQLFYVGASEYFQTPLTRWLARQVNLAPVDPDAGLVSAMQAGAAGLRAGRVLLLFPEGERSIDGEVRHFKKGAAILAHHVGVPVVPVSIDGVFGIWPRNRPLNWRALLPGAGTEVTMRVGEPLAPRDAGSDEAAYAASTARLRAAVVALAAGDEARAAEDTPEAAEISESAESRTP